MPKKRYYSKTEGERMGSSMMPSAKGAFANMFQGSFMKPFPMPAYMSTSEYVDTLPGIDRQMSGDVNKAKRNAAKTKF